MSESLSFSRINRRSVLLGSLGAVAVATGCQIDLGGETDDTPEETHEFDFKTDGVDLPADNVNFSWMDSGDLKAFFLQPAIEAFGEQHPNVTVTYDGAGWDQVNQVVPLGIRNGTAPDVFALPQNVQGQTAVAEGWVQPLDDLIPDFDQWRAGFPGTALIPGVHIFDDKVYSWPLNSTRRMEKMLFLNEELAESAGVDPDSIGTWDDLREAAATFSAAGTPGLMLTRDHLWIVLSYLANSAGWRGNFEGMDMTTGEYIYSAPEFLRAVEFIRSIIDDGSAIPGFLSLADADGRAQYPAGVAAMMFNGPWDIRGWQETNPDFAYGIQPVPSPDASSYRIPFREVGANLAWVYADTPVPEIAGVIMEYLGSVEGQAKMVELTQGTFVSMIPESNEAADQALLNPYAARAAELALEYMRACPQLEIRVEDAGAVRSALRQAEPGIEATIEGIFSGQLSDTQAALSELDDNLNTALDEAFEAARAQGVEVERSMMAFPNWDPSEDYELEDYEQL